MPTGVPRGSIRTLFGCHETSRILLDFSVPSLLLYEGSSVVESEILPYLPANMLVCHPRFHGCWQKTWYSWVSDKGLYDSWHSNQHELRVCVVFPCPGTHGAMQRGPHDTYTSCRVCHRRGSWFFLLDSKQAAHCSQGRYYLYLPNPCAAHPLEDGTWQSQSVPLLTGGAGMCKTRGKSSPSSTAYFCSVLKW